MQWAKLCATNGYTYTGPTTHTPGGGNHLHFVLPEGAVLGNGLGGLLSKNRGGCIDIRAPGIGYVIAPGADNEGGVYEPEDGNVLAFLGAPPIPDWLLAILTSKAPRMAPAEEQEPLPVSVRAVAAPSATSLPGRRTNTRIEAWAEEAFAQEITAVTNCGKGGRNGQLNTASFCLYQIVAAGFLDGQRVHRH